MQKCIQENKTKKNRKVNGQLTKIAVNCLPVVGTIATQIKCQ